jgi:hypothetical protein
MVVVVRFSYKSRVTWIELKDLLGIVQAKKHKKSQYFQLPSPPDLTSTGDFPPSACAAVHNPERISL